MDLRFWPNMYFWSPNVKTLGGRIPTGFSFKKRWKDLEKPFGRTNFSSSCQNTMEIPAELFSCYLEARAGQGAQFDASSYSSGTLSSGISSWREGRSFSSDSSRSRNRSSSSRSRGSRHRSTSDERTSQFRWRRHRSHSKTDQRHHSADSAASQEKARKVREQTEDHRQSRPREKTKRVRQTYDQTGKGGTVRAQSLGRLATGEDLTKPRPPMRRRKKHFSYRYGDLVWFDPGLGYVLPGEVIEFHRAGQVITVQAMIGGKSQVFTMTNLSSVRRRQDLGDDGIEDMIALADLNEASLLWNLKIRYDKEKIYTYTGSILVAVNPYRMFDIYGLDVVKKYEGQILGTLPPHIFAIGSAAYSRLSKDGASQCVVISGESGSGKTESTKLIMQYLAAVNKSQSNLITEQILEASPLLESFGNAKTVKNDNSSRFGKYLECFFKDGVITGAKITEYLLEKSRIVTQAGDERNYHVFYELLAGLSKEKKTKYGLTTADKYFYLNQGESCELQNKDDGEDFQALLSAMQVLGFSSEEQDTIFRILAAVLHLGNVYFHRKPLRHGQEGVEIGSEAEIKWASHLLDIDPTGIRRALTTKTTEILSPMRHSRKEARHERVSTPLNIDQALDSRDAVAKALYSALFSWLVKGINMIVHKGSKKTCISILDIFGFEVFKENSFEQLCINYANEKLQFYFNAHIFKLEQQEYAKEKIDWQNIEFQDNVPIIDLIARKPVGILHLLDDESNFPKATDASFLEKCHYNHALNELYSRPRMSSMEFGVKHYAGQVWYSVDGFLDKNRDTLRNDVVELLISSKLQMLSEMFIDVRMGSENKTLTKANGRFVTMKPRTPTVAARFNDSLTHLIDSMSRSNPWFVRCIKPNNEKAPLKLDMPLVLEQLRYSGMLETIMIRQQGFPVRLRFSHFADRYRCLIPGQVPRGAPSKEICRVVLDRSIVGNSSRNSYQLGASKIFLKESLEKTLEQERYKRLSHAVITIQRHTRGMLARKRYGSYKTAVVKIQSAIRMWQAQKKYKTLRQGVVQAQAVLRGRKMRKQFERMKEDNARRKKVEEMVKQRAARQAAQKEIQPERTKRTVAGVNHLEVPAELAYILSKTSDWSGPYNEPGHIIRVSNPLPSESSHFRLPHDVDYHAFTKFTNVYFKHHLWGMKREPIKTPFLSKQRDSEYADSLAVFKLILRFMNDPSLAGSKETVLGNYIANKGLLNERMRDEILCQLSNQTWKNDNVANVERGWLLMANCLSVFPPSTPLYKYLLKYVSDHGLNDYANLCQRKLLSSNKNSSGVARNFGPSELEWRANRKRARMALSAHYPDGNSGIAEIDSWTTAEEFASTLLQNKGINDSLGWSVTLSEHDSRTEITHMDYVLDLVAEKEIPPSFPAENSTIIHLGKTYKRQVSNGISNMDKSRAELLESPLVARKSRSPPPLTRKLSREALEAHDEGNGTIGLSRTSALNNRYFDDKGNKSRSLDNLLDNPNSNIKDLGLSGSKLNDRYHSMERLTDGQTYNATTTSAGMDLDNMESVSQRGVDSEIIVSGGRVMVGKGLDGSKMWNKFSFNDDRSNLDPNDYSKMDYPKAVSSRFIKASNVGRRAFPGSHSSRAQIEKGDYVKSSAMSDTSETPSLASHVRRVRVPSQASDVDQFLDDLFMPVLDHQLDELSDARSLAASLKGGKKQIALSDSESEDLDGQVSFASSRQGSMRRKSMLFAFEDIISPPLLSDLSDPMILQASIKGGGKGAAELETNAPTSTSEVPMGGFYQRNPAMSRGPRSPPPFNPMATMPLYSPAGVAFPGLVPGGGMAHGAVDPNPFGAYQQNVQRAFLQSAVAQNIQIQQHLMAQNQALQQLIQQNVPHVGMPLIPGSSTLGVPSAMNGLAVPQYPFVLNGTQSSSSNQIGLNQSMKVSFQEPEQGDLWSSEKTHRGSSREGVLRSHTISPPPALVPLGSPYSGGGISFHQATGASSPLPPDHMNKKQSGTSDETRMSLEMSSPPGFTSSPYHQGGNTRSPQPYYGDSHGGIVPPAPPMPEHLNQRDAAGNYLDPYQRAKTVRIGKWRWPPPKGEGDGQDSSFLHFKRKQSTQKKSPRNADGRDYRSISKDESVEIEWEEFEMGEAAKEAYANLSPQQSNGHFHQTQTTNSSYHEPSGDFADSYSMQKHQQLKYHKQRSSEKAEWAEMKEKSASPPIKDVSGEASDAYLMQKKQQAKYHKAVMQQRANEKSDWGEKKEKVKKTEEKTRKDSWDTDEDEEEDKANGIGKLKISREMRQKLEALTSSHPTRNTKGGGKQSKDKVVKKLEQNRRFLLEQQLAGDRWDTVDSVKELTDNVKRGPPPPIVPPEDRSRRRSPSPTASVSSQESSPVVAHTRFPSNIQTSFGQPEIEYRKERRSSLTSTVLTEKTEHFELEESSEFLRPVDKAPKLRDEEKEKKSLEGIRTHLLPPLQGAHLTYGKVPWTLNIRKEIFSPDESLSPEALHLVFCQIVLDVYGGTNSRLTDDESSQLKGLMTSYGVTPNNTFSPHHKKSVKKEVVELAKNCPLYFASIFPVLGSRKIDDVEFISVSHSGLRILKRKETSFQILNTYNLEEIEEAKCSRPGSLHLFLTDGASIVLYLPRAKQVSLLLTRFLSIIHAGSRDFVKAVADYVTREPTLLSFRKGDVIRVTNNELQYGDKGWLHGALDGRSGMFPVEYVTPIARNEASQLITKPIDNGIDPGLLSSKRETTRSPERDGDRISSPSTWTNNKSPSHANHEDSGHSSGEEVLSDDMPKPNVDDGKHSLFQFALQHFRGAKERGSADGTAMQKAKKKKGSKDGSEWTWKDLVELVKFTQTPLKASLLPLEGELNTMAVATFTAIMCYMGDFPMDSEHTEVHFVYTILMNCHSHKALSDEIYCQVMKQTTNNKSSVPESCQRGWRLFSIIAAYFTCSDVLKPYLLKYLETNAYDKRRAFHGTAMVCLQNIRKTFRYGGRKNVPSIEEITAITAGRNSKRQIYRLPGGTERVINTKSTSVVQDILEELCALINVRSQHEQEEFSLYCIVEGDSITMPLAREEYVLDVTTEFLKNKQIFYLIFCRSVYYYPLRLDNTLYIEVVFNQIAPDYLSGLLLVTPGEHLDQDLVYDIAKIAALMHRAADLENVPTIKEVKFLLPKPILTARDVQPPQWVNLVQGSWPEVSTLSTMEAKAAVLEILQNWTLFGSAFFAVERITEPEELVHTILALNKLGVHFLDPVTHETLITFTLDKIMSTRKVKGNDGELYLDMKCGNLMKPRIITLRTNQAHEISRQIRQYITIEQRHVGGHSGDHPKDVTLSR